MRWLYMTVVLLLPCAAWAAGDSFGDGARLESQYFTVTYKPGVDLNSLTGQLNVSKTDEVLTGQPLNGSSSSGRLASMLDVLFNRASDILDMHVYSYKGDIKVFATQSELAQFFQNLYHKDLPCTGESFYSADLNTIYVSAEGFRREVLGHEMGHAIMSRYFVVQPSVKIQEVLAGYVEYQLRKSK